MPPKRNFNNKFTSALPAKKQATKGWANEPDEKDDGDAWNGLDDLDIGMGLFDEPEAPSAPPPPPPPAPTSKFSSFAARGGKNKAKVATSPAFGVPPISKTSPSPVSQPYHFNPSSPPPRSPPQPTGIPGGAWGGFGGGLGGFGNGGGAPPKSLNTFSPKNSHGPGSFGGGGKFGGSSPAPFPRIVEEDVPPPVRVLDDYTNADYGAPPMNNGFPPFSSGTKGKGKGKGGKGNGKAYKDVAWGAETKNGDDWGMNGGTQANANDQWGAMGASWRGDAIQHEPQHDTWNENPGAGGWDGGGGYEETTWGEPQAPFDDGGDGGGKKGKKGKKGKRKGGGEENGNGGAGGVPVDAWGAERTVNAAPNDAWGSTPEPAAPAPVDTWHQHSTSEWGPPPAQPPIVTARAPPASNAGRTDFGSAILLDNGTPYARQKQLNMKPVRIQEGGGRTLESGRRALFGKHRAADRRLLWILPYQHDPRVKWMVEWIQMNSYALASLGFHKYLASREKGALITNVEVSSENKTSDPVFDWVTFPEMQKTRDRTIQRSIAANNPASTCLVFIFLPSKSGNSLGIWRRTLNVPKPLVTSYSAQVRSVEMDLRDKVYVVKVDPPTMLEKPIIPPPLATSNEPAMPDINDPPKKKKTGGFTSWIKWGAGNKQKQQGIMAG